MGSLSRSSGNHGELEAARLLDPHVPAGKIISTRNARGGQQLGLDLCVDLGDNEVDPLCNGWGIEVKHYAAPFPARGQWHEWLREAIEDTPPRARGAVVLYRMKRSPQWWACTNDVSLTIDATAPIVPRLVPADRWIEHEFTKDRA